MIRWLAGSVLWLAGFWILSHEAGKTDFELILSGFSCAFLAYFILGTTFRDPRSWKGLFALAIAARLLFMDTLPGLSDDIYRFMWDGHLQLDGIPLLSHTPKELLQMGMVTGYPYESLYPLLNSQDYHTIYPSVIQWINLLNAWIAGGNIHIFITCLRIEHILSDALAAWIIWKISRGSKEVNVSFWWYILNPLLITEGVGNLHFEGIAITFLFSSFYFYQKDRSIMAGILFSGSVLTKLHPLILLPALLITSGIKRNLKFLSAILITVMLASILTFSTSISNIWLSIELYFNRFEFNAGVYYILREMVSFFTGYNPIAQLGPAMAIASVGLILGISYYRREKSGYGLLYTGLLIYVSYFLMSTTVHPWYILFPLALSMFSPARIILVGWSFLVCFSYSHYWNGQDQMSWIWLGAEYILLLSLWILYRMKKIRLPNQ
jgi:hypothetical protein